MADKQVQKLLEELENLIDEKLEHSHNPNMHKKIFEESKEEIFYKLDKVLSIEPQNIDALDLKAFVYSSIEDYDTAIEIYEEILQIDPHNSEAEDNIEYCKEMLDDDSNLTRYFSKENITQTTPKIFVNVSIWHILLFKLVVLAGLIWWLFYIGALDFINS